MFVCVCVCVPLSVFRLRALLYYFIYTYYMYTASRTRVNEKKYVHVYKSIRRDKRFSRIRKVERACVCINYARIYRICVYTVYYNPVCKLR